MVLFTALRFTISSGQCAGRPGTERGARYRGRIRPCAHLRAADSRQWRPGSVDRRSSAWTRCSPGRSRGSPCVRPACRVRSARCRARCRIRCPGGNRFRNAGCGVARSRPSSGRTAPSALQKNTATAAVSPSAARALDHELLTERLRHRPEEARESDRAHGRAAGTCRDAGRTPRRWTSRSRSVPNKVSKVTAVLERRAGVRVLPSCVCRR